MMNFLRYDLRRAYEDKKRADVTFLVGYNAEEVEKIQAHSLILTLRSKVFDTQFSDPWIQNHEVASVSANDDSMKISTENDTHQKNANDEGKARLVQDNAGGCAVIEIPDANPAAFRSFLKYLYTDELEILNIEDTVGVLYLGVKYDVTHLADACLKFLNENLHERNVVTILEEATIDLYKNLNEIQDVCSKYFSIYAEELINSGQFESISGNVLKAILKFNNLGIEETQLFSRIYTWAEAECRRQSMEITNENIRSVLGTDVLYNIRFLSLSDSKITKDLAEIIWGPAGILTNEEQLSLFRRKKLGCDHSVNFKTKPRCLKTYHAVERLIAAKPSKEWTTVEMNKERNHCCVAVSYPAEIIGFGFFGSLSATNAKYEVVVEVTNPSLDTTYAIVKTKRVCSGPNKLITVFLEEPLLITSGMWYTICYSIKGPPTYAGDGNLKTPVVIKNCWKNKQDFTVYFANASENNSLHQLPIIYFTN